MSTWSGIRNKLENDYLCPALRGHIQYFATSYSKSADHEGRAAIRLDGVEVLRSNYYTYFENVWTKFHHLRSTTLKDHDSAKHREKPCQRESPCPYLCPSGSQAWQASPAGFGGIHGAGTGLGAGLLCDPDAGRRIDGRQKALIISYISGEKYESL